MRRIVIITGMSGSGKTTAKDAFEDMGFYCLDNFPLSLLHKFLELSEKSHEDISKLAFVMDARAYDFVKLFPKVSKKLNNLGYHIDLLFLEASDEVLARRFSETRRKHPLSMDKSAVEGIRKERRLLGEIKKSSTRMIDTSDMNIHALKDLIYKAYGKSVSFEGMHIRVVSFGYRYGLPIDADIVIDVRFLPNPYFRDEFKNKTGNDRAVSKFILSCGESRGFLLKLNSMLEYLIPLYEKEWKAYLNVCIGCTGGRHRSVVIANEIKHFLEGMGRKVEIVHRDIARR
jgi:UPF0042 nucleotide-binding protein